MRSVEPAAAALLLVLVPSAAAAAYDANGVALGARESAVKEHFPSAHCRPLEWASLAADRRCDDSRVELGGVKVRVTFYLKKDAVEAFDVRFDTRDLERLLEVLRKSYGAPVSEGRENVEREGKPARRFYRALWQSGAERALLSAELTQRRASMLVSRGEFEREIYRVR